MNAGTPLGWFSQVLHEVEALTKEGKFIEQEVSEKDFVYRDFPRAHDWIILGGTFQFVEKSPDEIEEKIERAKDKRTLQPLEYPNIGSVFKNPPKDYAGRLVEAAGLKGVRQGDAEISKKHANFIINLGKATTQDVLALIHLAQERVKEKFSVDLEPEVHLIGVET
jgi:UDP-N-acetylmuramate dehydrogenase